MAIFEPFPYYPATVTAIREETPRIKTFTIEVMAPWDFLAGQHAVIRLTDENGYIAARDFSISSAPSSGKIEFTVLHEPFGELSTWLHERIKLGDTLQISKPLGSDFSWSPDSDEPVLLLAGGIGSAPLISILREHRISGHKSPMTLAYSAKTADELCFVDDLASDLPNEQVAVWITQGTHLPVGAHTGRMTAAGLRPLLKDGQKVYICGPTSFVEAMEKLVHEKLSIPAKDILTERFG